VSFGAQPIGHLLPRNDLARRNVNPLIIFESGPPLPDTIPFRFSGSAVLITATAGVLGVRSHDAVVKLMIGAVRHLMLRRMCLLSVRPRGIEESRNDSSRSYDG
jgi:hypothetical protein